MKKSFIIILVALAVVTAAVVGVCIVKNPFKKNNENISAGGWTKVSSPVITDELRKTFDKAAGELTGMSYEPVAYLETQVVAGRNHLILCKGTATVPNARTYYSLLKIYERLDGTAEITSITDSVIEAVVSSEAPGGWETPSSPVVTSEAKNALEKASETLTGAEYKPIALLGTQTVAGTNYALLCEMKATVPDAAGEYAFVYVYEDLKGKAIVSDVKQFNRPDTTPTGTQEEQTETTTQP